jgi:hypothetical protein
MKLRLFMIVLLIVCTWLVLSTMHSQLRFHAAPSGEYFLVNSSSSDPQSAKTALHLEGLRDKLHFVITNGLRLYPDDERLLRIQTRWDGTLSEVEDADSNVAYSLGKRALFVCAREKDGTMTSSNSSMFVLLHELAHIATHSWGHTPEFWENFKFFLEIAEEVGVYRYENHDLASFCGTNLGANPVRCVKDSTCESSLQKKY